MSACAKDSATSPTASLQLTGADSSLIAIRASADATISDVSMINGISTTMSWSDVSALGGGSFSLVPSDAPAFSSGPGKQLHAATRRITRSPARRRSTITA